MPAIEDVWLKLEKEIDDLREEVANLDENIQNLQLLRAHRATELSERMEKLGKLHRIQSERVALGNGRSINYQEDEFAWAKDMKRKMKEVFGIDNYRLCQLGVCNANMHGRDIVCVMPTGGGKSLTYQLPAILQQHKITIVISPLISLISDQIMHLNEAGIKAVKLTGSTSKSERDDITSHLRALAAGSTGSGHGIKLLYVTPEKLSKNKSLMALIQQLYTAGRLARVVIDEAHCVSQMGHDFRPDYQNLHRLRTLMPRVPIMALSATCPPAVLEDLLDTLKLRPPVSGTDAPMDDGTVYFSSPLYRKNLHYKVFPKDSDASKVLDTIKDYILQHHPGESGIVYCLSKKNTETVADELRKRSGGRIKTGWYHADLSEEAREILHRRWALGEVQVVCATIAFGMGIDKGNVRFVLHHSMSKTVDGYYQETGRAGRDGKDADCVLYYRPQDAVTLLSMMAAEKDGPKKVHPMLHFAEELKICRKVLFAQYFSNSSGVSAGAWSGDADANVPCKHCDNCMRREQSTITRDVVFQAWQLLRIVEWAVKMGENLTIKKLVDLARGNASGDTDAKAGKGKKKAKEKLDLQSICGGKVALKRDDIETVIIHLLLHSYLAENFSAGAYTTYVYLRLGAPAIKFARFLSQEALQRSGEHMNILFRCKEGKPSKPLANGKRESKGKSERPAKRRKSTATLSDDDAYHASTSADEAEASTAPKPVHQSRYVMQPMYLPDEPDSDNSWEGEDGGWSFSYRTSHSSRTPASGNQASSTAQREVIDLSDSD